MSIKERFIVAFQFVHANIKKILPIYLSLLILGILQVLLDGTNFNQNETLKIIIQLIVFFLTILINVVYLKMLKKDSTDGDFWYLFIPFLLYSIYYSILGLLGLIILFIPGIIYYYLPIIATLSEDPPFKTSIKLAKNNLALTTFLSVTCLLLELIPYLLSFLVQDQTISITIGVLFNFFETFLGLIIFTMTVFYFYEFKEGKSPMDIP